MRTPSAATAHRSLLLRAAAVVLLLAAGPAEAAQLFYDDDPLWELADTQDASGMESRSIDLFYDLVENTFTHPGEREMGRALSINTVDEVPDSSWFVNRIGHVRLTVDDVAIGPNTGDGPDPGKWTLIRGKSDGITPGMTIVDTAGDIYFIKFDPHGHAELATGAEMVSTKLFWAFGYHVAENYIAQIHPEQIVIGESAMKTFEDGRKRRFTQRDVDLIFRKAIQNPDGSYRVLASKALPGVPLGPYRYYGTRTDDPNDIVAHEHRRELRGLRAMAAWLNHVDTKSINSMDTLIDVGDRKLVRHHLLDFGSTLGSAAVGAHQAWEGFEWIYRHGSLVNTATFGLNFPPWATANYPGIPSVGRFEADKFDPAGWKPRYPNPAFQHARPDDLFWAARRIMAFSDEMIRAAVDAGLFSDPAAARYLTDTLIARRDKVGKAFLPAVNPLVRLSLDDRGLLSFENAAVKAGVSEPPKGYWAIWRSLDNQTGEIEIIGETSNKKEHVAAPEGLPTQVGSFIRVDVFAAEPPHASWKEPVRVVFRRIAGGWKLVGLDRSPKEPSVAPD